MTSQSTLILVRKARNGDLQARDEVIKRYYQDWMDLFHGELGKTIRKLYDTKDLVQSAVADALLQLSNLRNESAFYTWVTSIIRHKIATQKRRLKREVPLKGPEDSNGLEAVAPPEHRTDHEDINHVYLQTLDGILALFPEHPEEMSAVVLKLLDEKPVSYIAKFLQASERTTYRLLQTGTALLKEKLES